MYTQEPFLSSPRSYLDLPSIPSLPPSILSSPLPTSLSMPSFRSHNALECQPQHHCPLSPVDRSSLSSLPRAVPFAPQHQEEDGDSLLLRTASVLVLSALEQRGHTWLAARKSSTSLSLSLSTSPTTSGGEYFPPNAVNSHAYFHRTSGMSTPRAVRSRHHSRRSSTSKSAPTAYSAADFVQRDPLLQHEPGSELNGFRNEKAPALNAESEVQNLLMARVGSWLDWAVGWMDFRDDDDDDDDDHKIDENNNIGNNTDLSAIGLGAYDNEHRHIRRGLDFGERMKAPRATLAMNIKGGTATKTCTAISKSKLDSGDRNREENESGEGAMQNAGIPLPETTYPQASSLLEPGAEFEARARAGIGNWAGVHDVWWGDAKWLFGVAGRVVW